MRKNTILTKDSWMSSTFDNKEYVFYEDIEGTAKLQSNSVQLIIYTYGCDSAENEIVRKVLSLADAASTAGGFAGVILMIARLIAGIYSKPLFYYEVFSKLYFNEPSNSPTPD